MLSKKRKLNNASWLSSENKSPDGSYGIISPADSSHYAESAKIIIQSELNGNESLKDERQSVLKSALEFVNKMAQRPAMISDWMPLELPEVDMPTSPEDIAPTSELFYMLFRGA
ncbi:hypothetical protein N7468_001524 [Penicillium chermesinum]|uniref:Uncharacterized protein n=1 Tax=Penicillium chermesinum TaxID=63820 RepID=A0A9W9PGQ5_9EURO|nr:uncharacterized protein N7468_001524 [Penicillium chermesinum]KAJ5246541.1 hypothetical protein N7468_001524 [Penicillium chermesinum]